MKKVFSLLLLCVIFVLCYQPNHVAFAKSDDTIEFVFNNKIFEYRLSENIKSSEIFDINHEINKYNRFSDYNTRKNLLIRMKNAGFEDNIIINYLFPNIDNVISKIEKTINIEPKNAVCKIDNSDEKVFKIKKEIVGRRLNKNTIYKDIINSYLQDKEMIFNLPVDNLKPEINAEYYKKFTNLRSDFSTNISSSNKDRKHNIKNALQSLNKIEILPNQTFSFNQVVGQRTEKNGYRKAKIIVNEEFVEGVGGGVCQVSTTLYNAALLAGLDIVEANKHSKQVSYITAGFDAMVNFGSSDLKFKNNTSEKITIITNYSQEKARIRIFGEDMGDKKYVLKNKISNIIEPIEEILVDNDNKYVDKVLYEDESFCYKAGSNGMTIESFVEFYKNGQLISTKKLRKDVFKPQNKITIFGSKKRTEDSVRDFLL